MNRLDFPYDEAYFPAMPVVEVGVDGYAGRSRRTVSALIDSGADGTMFPVDVLEAVDASYEDTVQMRGVLGSTEQVDRYTVAIYLGPLILHGVNAVAIPSGGESVLGRDILNYLSLTLNGPANMTEIDAEA